MHKWIAKTVFPVAMATSNGPWSDAKLNLFMRAERTEASNNGSSSRGSPTDNWSPGNRKSAVISSWKTNRCNSGPSLLTRPKTSVSPIGWMSIGDWMAHSLHEQSNP